MEGKYDGLVLLGSSGWDEYAISKGGDDYIGQPLTDEFSSEFINYLSKVDLNKENNL